MAHVRLIKHEAVPKCGSFDVRFADGAPSRFFYWDDVSGRRLRPEQFGSALRAAVSTSSGAEPAD